MVRAIRSSITILVPRGALASPPVAHHSGSGPRVPHAAVRPPRDTSGSDSGWRLTVTARGLRGVEASTRKDNCAAYDHKYPISAWISTHIQVLRANIISIQGADPEGRRYQ
ncbi:hypothetical protein BDZ94DRAFT_612257 [Collybia nuda]|uniref:Uncharacterized protein n=1 Tax=Collybia nuda TaxID=64659 RepID=A0A9P5Y787_9AGAR|nr:hypothetical protein BDZ94DRAFT_612257 [Collybia nuda]